MHGEKRDVFRVLMGTLRERYHSEDRCRWENNNRLDL
jgi:hypothetical protein